MIDLKKETRARVLVLFVITSLGILSAIYLKFHLDYDRFHSKADRIYLLSTKFCTPNETVTTSISPWTSASTLKSNAKFVAQAARIVYSKLRLKEHSPVAIKGVFADASIFDIFDIPFMSGNKNTALQKPLSIVLTQRAAFQLFNHKNPLGKQVFLQDFGCALTVTAVAENLPSNSQISADAFISMAAITQCNEPDTQKGLEINGVLTYILLKPNVSAEVAQKEFSDLLAGSDIEKPTLLSPKKIIDLKPLRATIFNPVLTNFQKYSLGIISLIIFLILLESINNVIKVILLRISLSDGYMTMTRKQRNRKLVWQLCLVTSVTYLLAYLTILGIVPGLKYIFDITASANSHPLYDGVAMLVILFSISIVLCLWIAYRVEAEPIKTYLTLKKER